MQRTGADPGENRGWIGSIEELTTNSDGRGVVSIKIDDSSALDADYSIATWNNAVSDFSSKTLIEPSSPLYQKLLALKPGLMVRFSGEFLSAGRNCIQEQSLTLRGSMTAPAFSMRFSDVTSIDYDSADLDDSR